MTKLSIERRVYMSAIFKRTEMTGLASLINELFVGIVSFPFLLDTLFPS